MDRILPTLFLGMAIATATTFDDNLYLTLFFSKTNHRFRPRHVIVGELIGFTGLVLISLGGFLAGLMIDDAWIGLLGLLPLGLGVNALINRTPDQQEPLPEVRVAHSDHLPYRQQRSRSLLPTLMDPQTYKVSAVTLANGGNNLAIYIPLFASTSLPRLSLILATCYGAIGLLLWLSYHLTRQPALAVVMSRYVRRAFPFVLIWLGADIMIENGSYQLVYTLLPGF
jgi:cadmium resistance protein CadD (predicted permease)